MNLSKTMKLLDERQADDLTHLKHLGLIDSRGHGRGAVWYMGQPLDE